MANSHQAEKRARQNADHAAANMSKRSAMRSSIKKTRGLASGATKETTQAALNKTASTIDKLASKGIIHRNKAARLKSRLNAQIKLASAQR